MRRRTALRETRFYHSFPRIPHQNDHALGLKILESILQKGLLITAELRTFSASEGMKSKKFIQRRVCFTALSEDGLADHAKTFGSFSLEFNQNVLRDFGAFPAVYFSGRLPEGEVFNGAGEDLARHLLEAHEVLGRLWKLGRDPNRANRKLAEAVLRKIHPAPITIQELYFTLQAILNLYYPTDDPKWTRPLHYYHQHEWKIVPNLTFDRTLHYRELNDSEKSDLLKINRRFFGAKLLGKPRVDYCSFFSDVAGKNVINSVSRIIVPDGLESEARKVVAKYNRNVAIVPASRLP